MNYVAAGLGVIWAGTFVGMMWLLDCERKRQHQALTMLQRQLVALVDKVAVSVADEPTARPSGKVVYMDEKREVELDAH